MKFFKIALPLRNHLTLSAQTNFIAQETATSSPSFENKNKDDVGCSSSYF